MSGVPRVSVVVPAFNARETIGEALDSIAAQSPAPAEVIVVDDASGDDTVARVQARVAEMPGLRVLALPQNGGPARARNAGIAAATGDWVAFLDGDDAWLPHRLACQLAAAAREPEVVLWCGAVAPFAERPPSVAVEAPPMRVVPLAEFVSRNVVATSTVLVRRDVLNDVGGFDEQFRGPEDYDLWMRIAAMGRVAYLETPLSRYRHVAGSLSMDDRTFLPEVLRVLDKGFAADGALADLASRRAEAVANQYWNASWMAYHRRDRGMALRYWWQAYRGDHRSAEAVQRPWMRLLLRYLFGGRGEWQ